MQTIIILDFGSQYTQLIARVVRAAQVYAIIQPYHKPVPWQDDDIKGIILSGSPASVNDADAPSVDVLALLAHYPILAICYGAQLAAKQLGGVVHKSNKSEYGRAQLQVEGTANAFFNNITNHTQVWMSHGDSILNLPNTCNIIATTLNIPVAAFTTSNAYTHELVGVQYHPEVYHSTQGSTMIQNFVHNQCSCTATFTSDNYISQTIQALQQQIGSEKVIMAISGGVDSTVAATLIHKAVGSQLTCVFVNNGLLRKGEYEQVLHGYKDVGLNVIGIQASQQFYTALHNLEDPEAKRKAIGRTFIQVFDAAAQSIQGVTYLGQGTIYPDVIESVSVSGPSVTIKSHHNVGGLPATMQLKLIEPLRLLFKDDVRRVGAALKLPPTLLARHPYPGPGLGIRILGAITPSKVQLLQDADDIYIKALHEHNLYNTVWQAGAILLPVKSVGVMGDERTYEYTIALRAVTSVDGMTADWAHLPYDFLGYVSNEIINKVRGINRVVYDISSKPPATIEWE